MNQMRNRMQALGLLDRAIRAADDDELQQAIDALDEDHRDGLHSLVDTLDADGVREAVRSGRIDGGMEAVAAVLTDACLAECIELLGDHADNPSSDELRDVLPTIVEHHGVAMARIMLAATVAGEAPAAAIIRDLLKSDDLVALPKVEEAPPAEVLDTRRHSDEEQAELREKRAAARRAKKEAERARKAQSAAARRR